MNFGYENEVLFSFPLDRKNLDTSSVISELKWLVCKEKCIPEKATLSLNLPRNSRSKESLLVQKALAALPKEMPKKIRHSVADGNIFFQWDLNQKSPIFQNSKITKIEFYPFDELLINNAAPQSWSIEKQASGASVVGWLLSWTSHCRTTKLKMPTPALVASSK